MGMIHFTHNIFLMTQDEIGQNISSVFVFFQIYIAFCVFLMGIPAALIFTKDAEYYLTQYRVIFYNMGRFMTLIMLTCIIYWVYVFSAITYSVAYSFLLNDSIGLLSNFIILITVAILFWLSYRFTRLLIDISRKIGRSSLLRASWDI